MRIFKRLLIYSFFVVIAYGLVLNFIQLINAKNIWKATELIFLIMLIIPVYRRAFYMDQSIRKLKEKEILPFSLFLFETPIDKLFMLLLIVKPIRTNIDNVEVIRINRLTYSIYSMLVITIVLVVLEFIYK
ncbi:hypothetical protein BH10BAC1_BH10BAC1_04520 [soil metagenome]